ncbi:MAG: DUF3653 domain-containing protein [Sedimenticola sp.]
MIEYGKEWAGWVFNRNGLFSPEGDRFDVQRVYGGSTGRASYAPH